MIGPVLLGAALLYLLISIAVVRWAIRFARVNHRSAKRWGWGTALVMYCLVFWDWIPTVAMHQYYCVKDAGFWVYKTLDQWKAENPGVVETLVATKGAPSRYEGYDNGHGKTDTYPLNQRFNWVVSQQDISSFLPIIRTEQQVKDVQKNEVLARYVDFSTGNSVKYTGGPPGPIKFWLHSSHCIGGEMNDSKLYHFFTEAKHLGEGKKK